MADTTDDIVRRAEATGRFTTEARRRMQNVYITGITDATLQTVEPEAWRVLNGYLHSPNSRTANYGGNNPGLDYEVRMQPNPLQPYLDRLQRRTR